MMYAINLDDTKRILRATDERYKDNESHLVGELPTGETDREKDIHNWKYIDNEYVYEPLPDEYEIEKAQREQVEEKRRFEASLPQTLVDIDEAICTLYELTLEV